MPVLGLISGMQAGPRPLSRCHSGVPALQLSQSRHIPFVSARRSLFTFQWFDIPIRAADYLLASSFSSFPSARPYAVSHLFSFLCQSFFGHFFFFFWPICSFLCSFVAFSPRPFLLHEVVGMDLSIKEQTV